MLFKLPKSVVGGLLDYIGPADVEHSMPNGTKLHMPIAELYQCAEMIFQDQGTDLALHSQIARCIKMVELDIRMDLWMGIVLAGYFPWDY
jgi:hypothetical protein